MESFWSLIISRELSCFYDSDLFSDGIKVCINILQNKSRVLFNVSWVQIVTNKLFEIIASDISLKYNSENH